MNEEQLHRYLTKVRDRISTIEEKLNDREAGLINARQEGRKEVVKWITDNLDIPALSYSAVFLAQLKSWGFTQSEIEELMK